MSNAQLYFAVAIPSALAFLGIVTSLITFFISNSGLHKRLDQMQNYMDARFNQADARFERMQNAIDLIQRDQKEFYAKQAVHDAEIASLKGRQQ